MDHYRCRWTSSIKGKGHRGVGSLPLLPGCPLGTVYWPLFQRTVLQLPLACPTFLAALALVARVADAGAHDAGAMVAAGHVDTLVGGHIALSTLPAAVAQAPALHILAIPATEHGAGGWGDSARSLA